MAVTKIHPIKTTLKKAIDYICNGDKTDDEIYVTTHVVAGELKTKSSKNLFKKLNEHSKDLQTKQEEIIKMHNSLAAQYEELKHLKNNMDDYLGRDKTEKKESVIGVVKKHQAEERKNPKKKIERS